MLLAAIPSSVHTLLAQCTAAAAATVVVVVTAQRVHYVLLRVDSPVVVLVVHRTSRAIVTFTVCTSSLCTVPCIAAPAAPPAAAACRST